MANIKTYDELRGLALRDAKRRLRNVINHVPGWTITDKVRDNGDVEKIFSYNPTVDTLLNIDFNTYGQLRELKYIVWRFELDDKELRGE